jgi:hypothetical protein
MPVQSTAPLPTGARGTRRRPIARDPPEASRRSCPPPQDGAGRWRLTSLPAPAHAPGSGARDRCAALAHRPSAARRERALRETTLGMAMPPCSTRRIAAGPRSSGPQACTPTQACRTVVVRGARARTTTGHNALPRLGQRGNSPTISSGRTHWSNCSPVTWPEAIAASRRVVPSL